ncbi:hypothetical protein M948_04560 [Virgibacillus sp. CM-4]|nr:MULTISPECIES: hypothetical protein [Virgibacillus]EQB37840.1 hypothetical protein M948_04560 [Virgibacillus sp. CM-4]
MVIKMEDKLTESILTAEQYMIQVKKYSLHEEIAKHFNMPLFELLEVMKELEGKIHKKLKEMHAKVLWVDYTEIISRMDKDSRNKKWFYVTIPSN